MLHVTVERDDIAQGVLRGRSAVLDNDALLGKSAIDFFDAAADFGVDVEAGGHVLLLRDFEPHHVVALGRRAVDREPGGIGSAMPERLQHRGHLGADAAHAAPVNDSCNSAHVVSSIKGLQRPQEAAPPAAVLARHATVKAGTAAVPSRQTVEIGVHVPLGGGVEKPLPFVALVFVEQAVHLPRHRRLDDLVVLQGVE